jgi:4-amino-4-deoxy-L-arabinose transferase-like glycosyltransferase
MKFSKLVFILILVASFAIRFWEIDKAPPALYWDEMDVGYQAYSFLKTGKDYFGNSFPIYFHSFADFRTPLFIYSTIPFVALLGLNEYSVRLPSVIFGVLSVVLLYFVFKELIGDDKWAWVPALFFAFSPWQIQYSRIAFELSLMIMLFLIGLLGFLKGLKNPKWMLLWAIGFGLSAWTYSTAKLFIPLFSLGLILVYYPVLKKRSRKIILTALVIFCVLLFPILFSNFFGGGGQRFSEISIFTDPTIETEINNYRLKQGLSAGPNFEAGLKTRFIDKLIYNKPLFLFNSFSSNYLTAISSEFLFLEGDPNLRHSPYGIGQLYRVEILLLLLGIAFLILTYKKNSKTGILLSFWIILAILPSALTREGGNHASRLFFLSPALILILSLGFLFVISKLSKRFATLFLLVYFLLFSCQVIIFAGNYFGAYKLDGAVSFQYGFQQAAKKADELKGSYDRVILDDNNTTPLMAYLFESQFDPQKFQRLLSSIDTKLPYDIEARKIDNLYFTNPISRNWFGFITNNKWEGKNLLITSANQMIERDPKKLSKDLGLHAKLIDVIYYPDNLPAFYLIEMPHPDFKLETPSLE